MFNFLRKKGKGQHSYACAGVWTADGLLDRQTENRALTLLWKAFIIYCIVAGGIGCILSALHTEYYAVIVQLVILFTSVLLVLLYYSNILKNVGYILILIAMIMVAISLRSYINSGFYSVINDLFEAVSDYFGSNATRSYGEQIGNRSLAVTVSMCYIGVACCLVINISITRKMRYAFSQLAVIGLLMLPLYVELEPSLFHVVQVLTGLFMAACIHRSRHYALRSGNAKYEKRKRGYVYIYSARTVAQLGGCMLAIIALVSSVLAVVVPKDTYHEKHPAGQLKQQTAETVENLSVAGIAGLFNFYDSVGGLTSGRLGGISTVRLDYETDLTVTFVPVAYERIYLRQFLSGEYVPFSNQWNRERDVSSVTEEAMQQAYEQGNGRMGKGKMLVENVAGLSSVYLPYYSLDLTKMVWEGRGVSYTYYTDFDGDNAQVAQALGEEEDMQKYLEIPEANREAVEQVCRDAGLDASLDPMSNVAKLAGYYQENIPYSYQPGATPYGKDFVNYFLLENRKGYCAHFASAAVLIFRNLGIPARYAEGYSIDPENISEDGTILDEGIEEYYEGYLELEQTAPVSVDIKDASAHAWVEIWVDGKGWQVADVTPATDEEEPGLGLWDMFRRFFGGGLGGTPVPDGGAGGGTAATAAEMAENVAINLAKAAVGILAFLILVLLLRMMIYQLCHYLRNRNKGRNDLLIDFYQRQVRKMARGIEGFGTLQNYEEQIEALERSGKINLADGTRQKLLSLLEQAGFSPSELTEEEDQWVRQILQGKRN